MLILKGDSGKSRIVEILFSGTKSKWSDSICIVYDNVPIVNDSIYLDSTKYSFEDLKECIKEALDSNTDIRHDYVIVYTNHKEKELKDLIDWWNKNIQGWFYGELFITCK